jgi:hypothetical protein
METYSEGTREAAKELQDAMQELNRTREAFENWAGEDPDDLVRTCAAYQAARKRVGRAFRKVKAAEAWESRQRLAEATGLTPTSGEAQQRE